MNYFPPGCGSAIRGDMDAAELGRILILRGLLSRVISRPVYWPVLYTSQARP